jgi:uncharacterized membrane protein YhaH (DUF805 family)
MELTEKQRARADKLLSDGGLSGVWKDVRGHIQKRPSEKILNTLIAVIDYSLEEIKKVPEPEEESIMDLFESENVPPAAPSSELKNDPIVKSDRIAMIECPSCAELTGDNKNVCEHCGSSLDKNASIPDPIKVVKKKQFIAPNNVMSSSRFGKWENLLFSIKGRCGRKVMLISYAGYTIISIILSLITTNVVWYTEEGGSLEKVFYTLHYMLLFSLGLPVLNIMIKRLHDRNRSGWFMLIALIPIVGPIWLMVECLCLKGNDRRNQYGDPT